MIIALIYLVAMAAAEVITVYISLLWGALFHLAILLSLMVHSALVARPAYRRFLLSLTLAPLVRIISLVMPLGDIPQIYRYPVIYAPLLMACLVIMGISREPPRRFGLITNNIPVQLAVLLAGFPFGVAEYYILKPEPLVSVLTLRDSWLPAVILIVCTGFVEELIFRGVLQHTTVNLFGNCGIVYISLLFAALHMGYHNWIDVAFVFLIALFFGWMVKKTGSITGVTLAHGLTNIMLYIVMPYYPSLISQLF
jgi:membrane protease YdiL (CAAX protease family)